MKKIIALLLSCIMMVTLLGACGASEPAPAAAPEAPAAAPATAEAAPASTEAAPVATESVLDKVLREGVVYVGISNNTPPHELH